MTSALDQLTAGITRNAPPPARASLTPVAGEAGNTVAGLAAGIMATKAETAATIPGDVPGVLMSRERLVDMAAELRQQAQLLLDVAAGLDVLIGVPEAVVADTAKQAATAAKLVEREADRKAADREAAEAGDKKASKRVIASEKFEADLKAKSEAAQAATFTALDAGEPEEPAADGWVCPEHGAKDLTQLEARSGRKYKVCQIAGCEAFEPPPARKE